MNTSLIQIAQQRPTQIGKAPSNSKINQVKKILKHEEKISMAQTFDDNHMDRNQNEMPTQARILEWVAISSSRGS